MLKLYKVGDLTFQFEEGKQPKGAVEVKPQEKAAKAPANKSRTVKAKE